MLMIVKCFFGEISNTVGTIFTICFQLNLKGKWQIQYIAHQRTSRDFYLDVEIFILVNKIELHLVAQSL
jgi:hypothetical protein